MIGRLVDAEAAGKVDVGRALRLAERTVAAFGDRLPPAVVVVLAPRFERPWRTADAAYLRFLADGLRPVGLDVVVVAGVDASPLPPGLAVTWLDETSASRGADPSPSLAGLVPDLLTPELADELRTIGDGEVPTVGLGQGRRLVDPSVRSRPTADLRSHHDRLSGLDTIDSSIRAYAHRHGTGYHCDVGLLVTEAWRQFLAGGHEIAIDLMEHVGAVVRDPSARARLLYELQGMRIALQRFDEARDVPDPPPNETDAIRGGLLMTSGWARVMTGDPHGARERLAEARRLLTPTIGGTRQFLYLDNIYALSLLRSGDPEASLAIERTIEAELDARAAVTGARDWQLTYVNSINQARLFKYRHDGETSRRYYDRAFATTLGCRSESDAVYTAVCLAQLHRAQGDLELAYRYWLRAALHWAAADAPEALAPRAVAGILGARAASAHVVDEVAAALHRELSHAATALGCELAERGEPPEFARTDRLDRRLTYDRLVGDDGWAVLTSGDPVTSALSGTVHEQLRGLLAGAIERVGPTGQAPVRSVVLPIVASTDVPTTWAEAREACVEHRVPALAFGSRCDHFSDRELADLGARRRLAHGYAVDSIDGGDPGAVVVSFTRYRTPVTLTGPAAVAVLATTTPITLAALADARPDLDRATLAATVEQLVADRILRTTLPADDAPLTGRPGGGW